MPKMPHAGEDHGKTSFIGCGNNFIVAHRTARLDYCRCSCFSSGKQTVREREEGVRRDR